MFDGRLAVGRLRLDPDADEREVEAFIERAAELVATRRLPSCALDVADSRAEPRGHYTILGEHTLDEVGKALDVTRERVRQLEGKAVGSLRAALAKRGIAR